MEAGSRVGPYQVVDRIGAGGMGEVYRARDTKLGRDVALKILPRAFTTDPDRLARFEREARLLATLNHPNIGAIYGLESLPADEPGGAPSPVLVLELIDGRSLTDHIATMPRGNARVRPALEIARQIADGLDTAHERGVIHRDLKPGNINITPDGVAKVLDFGLAKSRVETDDAVLANSPTETIENTRDGVILGTAAYMSPEQARGRPVDKRTDIWSFGCVLFELLTATRPFDGETTSDHIAAILGNQPDFARLPEATPAGIRRLLERCLEKDPKRRLRDIADARVEIDDELSGKTRAAASPQRVSPRSSPALAVAAVALLIGGSAIGWMAANRSSDTAAPAFDRVARIVSTAAHEYGAVVSPDGKWIAYLSDAGGTANVWVKFLAGGDPANLTAGKFAPESRVSVQATDYVSGLAVSPDGAQIAFTVADVPSRSATWVIPAPLGGEPRKLLQEGKYGVQWSPDGTRIVFVRAGGPLGDALIVANPDGQNETVLVKREGAQHVHWPRWSGDGKYIYFNHGPQNFNIEPTEVFRVATTGGAIERVIATARRAAFPFPSADGTGLIYAANPDTVDLNLWWRDLRSGLDTRLTSGIGEYTHPVLSSDGSMLIGTVLDSRQSLQRVAVDIENPRLEPVTDGYSGDFDPWSTPDGQRLVFSSSRTGNRSLWTARGAGTPAPLTSGRNFDERPAVSPDGRQIAFVSDRDGRRGIWLMSAEGGTPRLVVTADVVDTLSWSPDGGQLVYATPNGDAPGLVVVDVATGKVTPLKTPKDRATGPTWSRDNVIAFIEPRGGDIGAYIQLIRPNGEPVASSPLDAKGAPQIANGSLMWSPDGKRLAASSLPGAGAGSLWIVDPASPKPYRKLLDLPASVFTRGITWANDGKSLIVGTYKWTGDIFLAERSAPR